MTTATDTLWTIKLDFSNFLKSLSDLEAPAYTGMQAVAEILSAGMTSAKLPEKLNESALAARALVQELSKAVQSLKEVSGSMGGLDEAVQSLEEFWGHHI